MSIVDFVNKNIGTLLNDLQLNNVGRINDNIIQTLTLSERAVLQNIETVHDWIVDSAKAQITKVTSFLPAMAKIAVGLFDLPIEAGYKRYYTLEKLSLNEYIELYRRAILSKSDLIDAGKFIGYNVKTIEHSNKLFSKYLPITNYIELFSKSKFGLLDLNKYAEALGFSEKELNNVKELYKKYLSLSDYIQLNYRGVIDDDSLLSYANKEGFNRLEMNNLKELYKKFLNITDYIQLKRRELITDESLTDYATKLGFTDIELGNLTNLTKYYPSVSDLVSFAVREAFEPDEKLFIHDLNVIPEPFSEYGKRIGLDESWIKKFWHSHWRLLGAEQILEAFHRGFISESVLKDYLRRLDYTERDRETILSMSYNLLTRVDVRRIFENGLMSSREVFDYYGTLGFSENDQTLMTSLAKQGRFIDMKDLRKLYIDEFEAGLSTESEVKENLRGTGLDLDEITLYLNISDKIRELEFTTELKNQLTQRFYEGIIDFDELVVQLRELGVSNRELRRIKKNAVLFDFRKTKLPTIAELKRFLKKDIIDLTKFVYYALRIGYGSEHIHFILSDMDYKF